MFQLAADTARDLCSSGDLDVVQIEGLEMAPIGLVAHRAAAEAGQRAPLLAYDAHNAEWVLQDRAFATDISSPMRWHGALYSAVQTRKLRRYERHLLEKADVTIAVSDRDADALRELGASRPVAVVPNGVDTEAYRPAEHDRQHDRQHHRRDDGRDARSHSFASSPERWTSAPTSTQ
jgi:glycosyltransferase involved in cell wall biosynthesis